MIVAPNGEDARSYLFSRGATAGGGSRPWVPTRLEDIDKLIRAYDRKTLVGVSRHMVENWGPTKAIALIFQMLVVGSSWRPSMQSSDKDYRKEIETIIREQFIPAGNLSGGGRSVQSAIADIPLLRVRDGESFWLLTEYSGGFPALQNIPSHRIGTRNNGEDKTLKKGKYSGAKIIDGVILNRLGTVIAYQFLGETEKEDEQIPAQSIVHDFVSMYPEGRRGYPMIAHGLNDARDSMQSHEWERMNMLWRSSITAIENNQDGVARGTHPSSFFSTPTMETGADGVVVAGAPMKTTMNVVDGPGRTLHYKAGTGSKLELLKHDNPGEIYESFGDRMIRSICAGVPIPISVVWQATGQGTAERRDIEQTRRVVSKMQADILPAVRRIFGYATKKFVKLGLVSDSPDWWRWKFSPPPEFSIDPGRDIKAKLDLHSKGLLSDGQIIQALGYDGDDEEYWTEKFNDACEKEILFKEIQKQHGVTIDDRYKGMWTPNDQGPEAAQAKLKKTTSNEPD
jgi:capsid protein